MSGRKHRGGIPHDAYSGTLARTVRDGETALSMASLCSHTRPVSEVLDWAGIRAIAGRGLTSAPVASSSGCGSRWLCCQTPCWSSSTSRPRGHCPRLPTSRDQDVTAMVLDSCSVIGVLARAATPPSVTGNSVSSKYPVGRARCGGSASTPRDGAGGSLAHLGMAWGCELPLLTTLLAVRRAGWLSVVGSRFEACQGL